METLLRNLFLLALSLAAGVSVVLMLFVESDAQFFFLSFCLFAFSGLVLLVLKGGHYAG